MTPRRTLVVTNDFPPRVGGIESFVASMTALMPADEVVVHTNRQVGDLAHDACLAHPVVRDPARLLLPGPALARRVAETARRHGCDTAWFGAAAPLGLLAPALRRAGVRRTVATTHGHEVWWAAVPGTRQALRAIAERNDVMTYLVEHTRSRIAAALPPALHGRLEQLVPGVDPQVFRPGAELAAGRATVRARYDLGERPTAVCVSRLVPRKGQDVLVRAWPSVMRRVPGAALLLVGEGPHRPHLEELVRERGLGHDVVLAGRAPADELAAHHGAGDVFVMPSRDRLGGLETEGLGICYLEAAACGIPVIAGRSGGAPETVRDGVSGLVVDGTSPDAVADAVVALLGDPTRRAAMGAAGREFVLAGFTARRQAERLRALLAGDQRP